jgi:flotillin
VLPQSSGQGASCWKLPGDSVAVVPTTVQQLKFTAAQVTREKVGLEVTGLAVYRIAEPLIAFRMLNFSFPERAQEKLELLLAEAELGIAEIEIRKTRATQDLELSRTRLLRDIENAISPEAIQLTVAQQLPQLAAAFQQKMGEVHITAVDGANPFGYIASAMEGVLGLARSAGLSLGPQKKPADA